MNTRPDDEELRLGNQLCFAVYSTANAFSRAYKPLLDALDLTYCQYLVMLTLWERDDVTVKDIGAKLFLDSGTLTPLLKRLEAIDLVRRSRDPEDERHVRITLTPKGRAMREKARSIPKEIVGGCGRSAEDLRKLKHDLVHLRDRLDDMTD
jgi:DNA-binding MarR family transcriptional regulator